MNLRQKVLFISTGDPFPYEKNFVQKKFCHTVLTGLRNNNIRNELRPYLKEENTPDEDLLEILNLAVHEESEHCDKFAIKNKVTVNSMEAKSAEKKPKENPLLSEIKEMRAQFSTDIASMRHDIDTMKHKTKSHCADHHPQN